MTTLNLLTFLSWIDPSAHQEEVLRNMSNQSDIYHMFMTIFPILFVISIIIAAFTAYSKLKESKAKIEESHAKEKSELIKANAEILSTFLRMREGMTGPLARAAYGKMSPDEALKRINDVYKASEDEALKALSEFNCSDDDLDKTLNDLLSGIKEEGF